MYSKVQNCSDVCTTTPHESLHRSNARTVKTSDCLRSQNGAPILSKAKLGIRRQNVGLRNGNKRT